MFSFAYVVWGACFIGMGILTKEIVDGITDTILDIQEKSEIDSKVKNGYAVYINDRRVRRLKDDLSSFYFDEIIVDDDYQAIYAYVYEN